MLNSDGYMIQCAWCKKVLRPGGNAQDQDDWGTVSKVILKSIAEHTISHSICPSCREGMREEITQGGRK